jgi:hypothetical protein
MNLLALHLKIEQIHSSKDEGKQKINMKPLVLPQIHSSKDEGKQ